MARIYKAKFRVDSEEVQGPGSWVEFKRPTWGMIEDIPDDDRGKHLLNASIVAWNWTDDDDKPIPLPVNVEDLPQQEANWLIDNCGIAQKKEEQKN